MVGLVCHAYAVVSKRNETSPVTFRSTEGGNSGALASYAMPALCRDPACSEVHTFDFSMYNTHIKLGATGTQLRFEPAFPFLVAGISFLDLSRLSGLRRVSFLNL